jgi:hypothetical protein
VQGPVIASQVGTTTTDLDDRDRPTQVKQEGAYFQRPTTTSYDYSAEVHRVLKTLKTTTSPVVSGVETAVDDFGRVVRQVNTQEVTNRYGAFAQVPTTTSLFDYRGRRLVRETRTVSSKTSNIDRVIDAAGRALSEVVSVDGSTVSFGTRAYDVGGRVSSNDFATRVDTRGETYVVSTGRRTWTRDAAGRELSFTLTNDSAPEENTVLYSTWDDDRLTASLYDIPGGGGAISIVGVAYDGRQQIIERALRVGSGAGTTAFTDRDALSRAQQVRVVGGADVPRVDSNGLLLSRAIGPSQLAIYGVGSRPDGSDAAVEMVDLVAGSAFAPDYCDASLKTAEGHAIVDEQLRATRAQDREALAATFGVNPARWPCEVRLLVQRGKAEGLEPVFYGDDAVFDLGLSVAWFATRAAVSVAPRLLGAASAAIARSGERGLASGLVRVSAGQTRLAVADRSIRHLVLSTARSNAFRAAARANGYTDEHLRMLGSRLLSWSKAGKIGFRETRLWLVLRHRKA